MLAEQTTLMNAKDKLLASNAIKIDQLEKRVQAKALMQTFQVIYLSFLSLSLFFSFIYLFSRVYTFPSPSSFSFRNKLHKSLRRVRWSNNVMAKHANQIQSHVNKATQLHESLTDQNEADLLKVQTTITNEMERWSGDLKKAAELTRGRGQAMDQIYDDARQNIKNNVTSLNTILADTLPSFIKLSNSVDDVVKDLDDLLGLGDEATQFRTFLAKLRVTLQEKVAAPGEIIRPDLPEPYVATPSSGRVDREGTFLLWSFATKSVNSKGQTTLRGVAFRHRRCLGCLARSYFAEPYRCRYDRREILCLQRRHPEGRLRPRNQIRPVEAIGQETTR